MIIPRLQEIVKRAVGHTPLDRAALAHPASPHTCTAHRVDTVAMRWDARTPAPQYTHPAQIECGPHPTETVHVQVQLALSATNNNSRSTAAGPVDAWSRSPDV